MRIDSIGMIMSNNYVIFLKYAEIMSREEADPEKLQKILIAAGDELRHNTMM
jgi:predicted PolB exonuclease-like 3'-5' exonuclease